MPDLKIFPDRPGRFIPLCPSLNRDMHYDYGDFALPFKRFSLGIPSEARVSYEISDIVYETISDITLAATGYAGQGSGWNQYFGDQESDTR